MYQLTWITGYLATGHAPMSYEDLDSLREQGIGAIVNLCGEFCDLHQIEASSGFDVYYLPVADEYAPDLAAMEKALDWLDEALYLGKKVLVHCRLGHGRTGTFIAAYLLRRGFDFPAVEKTMKGRNANPATYHQRSFLKKYGKKEGPLKSAVPRIDNRPADSAAELISRFRTLLDQHASATPASDTGPCCGRGNHPCCSQPFDLLLIESMHVSQVMGQMLKSEVREQVVARAVTQAQALKEWHHEHPGLSPRELLRTCPEKQLACPLLTAGDCLIFADRPLRCRCWTPQTQGEPDSALIGILRELSRAAFQTLTGQAAGKADLRFSSADTMSGKFVQLYFQTLMGETRGHL